MKVGRMKERILIQKNAVAVDDVGNHRNEWTDFYACYTYPSTYNVDESKGEVRHENRSITFSVRNCPESMAITATGFRVLFRGETYNIEAVDCMNFNMKEVRIRCTLEVKRENNKN